MTTGFRVAWVPDPESALGDIALQVFGPDALRFGPIGSDRHRDMRPAGLAAILSDRLPDDGGPAQWHLENTLHSLAERTHHFELPPLGCRIESGRVVLVTLEASQPLEQIIDRLARRLAVGCGHDDGSATAPARWHPGSPLTISAADAPPPDWSAPVARPSRGTAPRPRLRLALTGRLAPRLLQRAHARLATLAAAALAERPVFGALSLMVDGGAARGDDRLCPPRLTIFDSYPLSDRAPRPQPAALETFGPAVLTTLGAAGDGHA